MEINNLESLKINILKDKYIIGIEGSANKVGIGISFYQI